MPGDIFEKIGFHPVIAQWFKGQFAAPSPPQEQGWPSIAAGNHTLILAPTGSGKTLAAFLGSIDQLFRNKLSTDFQGGPDNSGGIHTLYISPLKALNNDIYRNLQTPLREIQRQARQNGIISPQIRVAVRTGDTPPHVRRSMLSKPPHILITTPESLYLLLTSERARELFRSLDYVIVDEIHAISNNKRGVHLSLSLERLMPLCEKEPIRIGLSATQKPLQRIAAFLGGQRFLSQTERPTPRPVNIIDCGQRKNLDLKVITPVASFNDLPESSVWQPVYGLLYKLIRAHKTTLVFANMRAQTEKIARQLNDIHRQASADPEAQLALAHHGSISREVRCDIEARLKAGRIPAVIATASLELGIDIGSIDLVVNLGAPRNVAGALQRVGRSGHLLSATSKGRILVLYPSDLDDAVTIAHCMHRADIEDTKIPENALDVLGQQIVAEVAVKSWDYHALYRLIRQSYCYRNLSPALFKSVIEMLTGRFSDTPLQTLQARISWDKVNHQLISRRGSRMTAVMNGGTIPDRGYYGVYLKDSNIRVGEVEEEFVFESRIGEAFFLGNSEWRIDSISQSRIIVTPIAAIKPKAPFWKGGTLFRDYATCKKIGQFRQKLLDRINQGNAEKWLSAYYWADRNTAENLVDYFRRQREQIQAMPTDKCLVVEMSVNADGERVYIVHTTFGARVNGAWAIALAAALERHCQTKIQYSFDDDGVLIRLPEMTERPPMEKLFNLSPEEIERHLVCALPESPIFAVQFRYNAARSLLLPRSQPRKRIPLWLQRLRAADLLEAVRRYTEFPVVIETYRDCLQDVFDLPTLKKIIYRLNAGRIQIRFVETAYPSPMAANILFKFVASNMYELDKTRRPGQAAAVSAQFMAEILDPEKIPAILTPELIHQAETRWQHLTPEFKASSAEDVFNIIEKLGPIGEDELHRRCKSDPTDWLAELRATGRIIADAQMKEGQAIQYRSVGTLMPLSEEPFDRSQILQNVRRYLLSRGPADLNRVKTDLKLSQSDTKDALKTLHRQGKIIRGLLIVGNGREQWCDRHNFIQLYRMAIVGRRKVQTPAEPMSFNRFLFEWHRIANPGQLLVELIRRYRGLQFPVLFFEREIMTPRFGRLNHSLGYEKFAELEALISNGDVIVQSGRNKDPGRRYVQFRLRGDGNVFSTPDALPAAANQIRGAPKSVYDFLKENGASYIRDMEMGTGLTRQQLQLSLRNLADRGLASCENYQSFLLVLQTPYKKTPHELPRSAHPSLPTRYQGRQRSTRSAMRNMVQKQNRIRDGRWFLTTSLAIMGKPLSESERAAAQARLLLQRYGILVKESYRREHGLLPWFQIFQTLKRLEWQGEIRRGYFVKNLSGVQFALPEAVDLLEKFHNDPLSADNLPVLLNSMDPALPYSGAVDWGLIGPNGFPLKIVRAPSNHLAFIDGKPVLYSENFFQRLSIPDDLTPESFASIAAFFRDELKWPPLLKPRNRIEISLINRQVAATSRFADRLLKMGYEKDGDSLVLWPSAI